MAIPRLICVKSKGTGMVQVYELVNGTTLNQLGNDVTGVFESPLTATSRLTNRAITFNGIELIYHRNQIHERNAGGADTWGAVATFGNQISTGGFGLHSGLYEVQINGTPTVIATYQTPSGHIDLATSTDGTTWSTTASAIAFNVVSSNWGADIVYRNKLYSWINGNSTDIVEIDPVTGTGTAFDLSIASNQRSADFCVHDNRLFAAYGVGTTAGSIFRLAEFDGGAFNTIHNFTNDVGSTGEQGALCLFTDNTDLYAILNGEDGNDDGTSCFRIIDPGGAGQSVLNVTAAGANSTNGVIPAGLQPGSGVETDSYASFINSETDPANPEIYIIRTSGPGQTGTYEIYQYVDKDTTLTSLGAGPSADVYLPNEKFGGGSRVLASGGGKIYAAIENHQELANGNLQFQYRVYGSGSDVTGRLYITGEEQIPDTLATVLTASGGSSSVSAGTIIDITPDNAATLYTATFNASAAGLSVPGSGSFILDLT